MVGKVCHQGKKVSDPGQNAPALAAPPLPGHFLRDLIGPSVNARAGGFIGTRSFASAHRAAEADNSPRLLAGEDAAADEDSNATGVKTHA